MSVLHLLTAPGFDFNRNFNHACFCICPEELVELFADQFGPFEWRGSLSSEDADRLLMAAEVLRIRDKLAKNTDHFIEAFTARPSEWATEYECQWVSDLNRNLRTLFDFFDNRCEAAQETIESIMSARPIRRIADLYLTGAK